jgi:hypothetical protein
MRVVAAEVSVPGAALDGEADKVQVSPEAVPKFCTEALKLCVFPAVSDANIVAGLSEMDVAGMVKLTVAQTLVDTEAHPCTMAFCAG